MLYFFLQLIKKKKTLIFFCRTVFNFVKFEIWDVKFLTLLRHKHFIFLCFPHCENDIMQRKYFRMFSIVLKFKEMNEIVVINHLNE